MSEQTAPGYELLEVIGRGRSVVRRARTQAGQIVAIKFLSVPASIGLVAHPNIVPVLAVGENDRPFIVTEFVEGTSLAAQLRSEGPLPSKHVARIASHIAEALAAAHAAGVVHGSLKPTDVLLVGDEPARVIDVGTPIRPDDDRADARYRPPEGGATMAGDIYRLGGVLYAAMTATEPFKSGDRTADPVAPSTLVSSTPSALEAICLRCLARRPEDRYASAGDLADDLDRFLSGADIRGWRPDGVGEGSRWSARHPAISLALVALIFWLAAPSLSIVLLAASLVAGISVPPVVRWPWLVVGTLTGVAVAAIVNVSVPKLDTVTVDGWAVSALLGLTQFIATPTAKWVGLPLLGTLVGVTLPSLAAIDRRRLTYWWWTYSAVWLTAGIGVWSGGYEPFAVVGVGVPLGLSLGFILRRLAGGVEPTLVAVPAALGVLAALIAWRWLPVGSQKDGSMFGTKPLSATQLFSGLSASIVLAQWIAVGIVASIGTFVAVMAAFRPKLTIGLLIIGLVVVSLSAAGSSIARDPKMLEHFSARDGILFLSLFVILTIVTVLRKRDEISDALQPREELTKGGILTVIVVLGLVLLLMTVFSNIMF